MRDSKIEKMASDFIESTSLKKVRSIYLVVEYEEDITNDSLEEVSLFNELEKEFYESDNIALYKDILLGFESKTYGKAVILNDKYPMIYIKN